MSSQSSNAVLAKARAMYGRALTDNDYRQLTECRTVPEVASYLKSRTSYGKVLSGLNENEIHRSQLEPILKQNVYFDVLALSRYASDDSLRFSEFIISKLEIEQIIHCLILLNVGKPEEYLYTMPLSLDQFTNIDLGSLTQVKEYSDILSVLSGTKYAPILKSFTPKDGETINITEIEIALNNQNYSMINEAIENSRSKSDKRELKDVFSAILDFENVERILRLKRYYNMDPEKIKSLLIPYGKLSDKMLSQLCSAENEKEAYELSRSTYLGKLMSKLTYSDRTRMTDALMYVYCKHHLRLSPNPTIVMISYVYLKEIELTNIVNIIEATRYGMSDNEKADLLVR